MTPEQRKLFMDGYTTPKEQLLNRDVDQFNRDVKDLSHISVLGVKIIPTSNLYRENYGKINWHPNAVWEEKG